ncbi:MAG: hypothetical protein JOZ69_13140 [Myxococcales bacterium]|nr:hypothetical protein [Myxococcales bacterium]
MHRAILLAALTLATSISPGRALADSNARHTASLRAGLHAGATDGNADHETRPAPAQHKTFGMDVDVGVPDGAAVGLVVRPQVEWLRLAGAVTHNTMAPGLRLGATLDPIDFPVAPTFSVEGGHYWEGAMPFVKGSPSVAYNYANLHLGLEVGSRASFRFFVRGGASWLDVSTAHFQNTVGGGATSAIGDPTFHGWLAPSGKLGFSLYF